MSLVRKAAAAVRGAWWALGAVRSVRRQLRRRAPHAVRVPAPPAPTPGAGRGVGAVLRCVSPSCLECALVMQRWLGAMGTPRAVVIGVTAPGPAFRAHAWLDGEPAPGFSELTRIEPC